MNPPAINCHSPYQTWIQSNSAGDVTNDFVWMCFQHLLIQIILFQQVHVVSLDDRDSNAMANAKSASVPVQGEYRRRTSSPHHQQGREAKELQSHPEYCQVGSEDWFRPVQSTEHC